MKKYIWLFVLEWIENTYLKTLTKKSSQMVDCCLALKEDISNG